MLLQSPTVMLETLENGSYEKILEDGDFDTTGALNISLGVVDALIHVSHPNSQFGICSDRR